jgi:hypothetical protein
MMKTYQLSATGRRNVMLLMIGAGLIWIFAIWTFQSTLAISYSPGKILDSLQAALGQGLTVDRTVPALFMLVLMVAAPLTIWNIAMEWVARYTPTGDGLRYDAFGISLVIPWSNISDIRAIDADSDEPSHELRLKIDPSAQINNPVLRLLHVQAYGRVVLPVYAGIEHREELIDEIRRRANLS